jgi:hypothetical protein
MARYKHYDYAQMKMLPVMFASPSMDTTHWPTMTSRFEIF